MSLKQCVWYVLENHLNILKLTSESIPLHNPSIQSLTWGLSSSTVIQYSNAQTAKTVLVTFPYSACQSRLKHTHTHTHIAYSYYL